MAFDMSRCCLAVKVNSVMFSPESWATTRWVYYRYDIKVRASLPNRIDCPQVVRQELQLYLPHSCVSCRKAVDFERALLQTTHQETYESNHDESPQRPRPNW